MSIQKYEYELSVWKESLAEEGARKEEKKMCIIGAQDMSYLGRATDLEITTNLNGTHKLTFQMPDRYCDPKTGEFIHNEFVDGIFNESKVKFQYKGQWYEFVVKNVADTKQFKSYMKKYTCEDSFIDELSRNGYGITFDEELYNNVDEIGAFMEEILKGSVWEYDAALNWGDFTEYTQEKLYKIPLSFFGGKITAHKLDYSVHVPERIRNIFTGENRTLEMGDDAARGKYFWDEYTESGVPTRELLGNTTIIEDESGYLYVPYTQLDFCFVSSDTKRTNGLEEAFAATEEPATYGDKGYALAPNTIDPNGLIQFMYIPEGAEVEVGTDLLLMNKEYTYVITVKEWNEMLEQISDYFYCFEDYSITLSDGKFKVKKLLPRVEFTTKDYIHGNWACYYEGYLEQIGDLEILDGKKISITDRTEINISEDINQYVKVYNNLAIEYEGLYTNEDWVFDPATDYAYRVCSKTDTRQIVPQLARNLIQNGKIISSTVGWEIMCSELTSVVNRNAAITFNSTTESNIISIPNEDYTIDIGKTNETFLVFSPAYTINGGAFVVETDDAITEKNAMVNFGVVGQEKTIEKGKTYVLGIKLRALSDSSKEKVDERLWNVGNLAAAFIRIGEGKLIKDGDYAFNEHFDIPLSTIIGTEEVTYVLIRPKQSLTNPYVAIYSNAPYELAQFELFEAYTKGVDQFESGEFKYSGRELFASFTTQDGDGYYYSSYYIKTEINPLVIFEDDVMPGDTYAYQRYFIQQLKTKDTGECYDTFGAHQYTTDKVVVEGQLPLDEGQYTEEDYEIITNYIDLNECEHYDATARGECFDCKYGSSTYDKVCMYQKYGYCPYRFQTEKHCRRIRTLKGEKSNRFNLTQELSKVFQAHPIYWTSHAENGVILTQQQAVDEGLRDKIAEGRGGFMDKRIFFITEKGRENKLGFRYGKNLSNISRTIASDKIVSKLYVLDVDSEISDTGLCTIKTALNNPSKDNFIIDFSYYIMKGLLNKEATEADLYGIDEQDMGYLRTLGYLNTQYDELSNRIINLSAKSFTELQANLDVNLTGIEAAQKRLRSIEYKMTPYTAKDGTGYSESTTFKSYLGEYYEQYSIYVQLIEDTFYTNGVSIRGDRETCPPCDFLDNMSIEEVRKLWVDTHNYQYGILGQYNREYLQIKEWTKERACYLRRINELSERFYHKYEPYLKEGTWSDSNYISDDAYYFGALQVSKKGAIPKVSYSISTVDIEPLYQEGDYVFDVADTTYVEDIGMFGINQRTGLPNRLKVIVSAITEKPDDPSSNKIEVQDYTTEFKDLFQQVSASVQSLSFNENVYRRASNFTSQQYVETESLQGTLSGNDLTLINTEENNIQLDATGQAGSDINNHANKYKLNGQGLFFSNNGGQTWQTAITPSGINADYIKVGTLDASRIRIVDGNYIYFGWDRNGISAYKDPHLTAEGHAFKDFAQFNKYGLSLVENNKIKLRAGYGYIPQAGQDAQGDITKEAELSDNTPIGFYLYNSSGMPIFSTTSYDAGSEANTARITLIGEMLASNQSEITLQQYEYSGRCYTAPTDFNYYDLPSNANILKNANLGGLSYDAGTQIAMCNKTNANLRPVDYAAAIMEIGAITGTITKIIITDTLDNNTQYEFNNPSKRRLDATGVYVWGKFPEGQYVHMDRFAFSSDNGSAYYVGVHESTSTPIFSAISDFSNVKATAGFTFTTESVLSQSKVENTSSISGVNQKTRQSGTEFNYWQEATVSGLYKIGNKYYQNRSDYSSSSDGEVALYINNRTDLSQPARSDTRLFCCCTSESDTTKNVRNIFTILKDGSLHMGGTINKTGRASELPDEISINDDSYLRIRNGQLQISFRNIVDIQDPSKSVESYVEGAVGNSPSYAHYHKLPSESVQASTTTILSPSDTVNSLADLVAILRDTLIPTFWYGSDPNQPLLYLGREGFDNSTGSAQE